MPKADLSGKRAVYPVEQRQRHEIPHIWMTAERKRADRGSDKAAANDRDNATPAQVGGGGRRGTY